MTQVPVLPNLVDLEIIDVNTDHHAMMSTLTAMTGLQRLYVPLGSPEPDTMAALTRLTELVTNPWGGWLDLLQGMTGLRTLGLIDIECMELEMPDGDWLGRLESLTANWETLDLSLPALAPAMTSLQHLRILDTWDACSVCLTHTLRHATALSALTRLELPFSMRETVPGRNVLDMLRALSDLHRALPALIVE